MKILVATDDRLFNYDLCAAYISLGFEVHTGLANLFLRQQDFDLIHFQWPEELASPNPTDRTTVQRAIDCVAWWRQRSTLVCSVHNLLPHYASKDGTSHWLYESFYAQMHAIGHFNQTSREAVAMTFPAVSAEKQFIHGMNLYSGLRRFSAGRTEARKALGIADSRFVVAAIGQLRSAAELTLVQDAIDRATDSKPLPIFASRLPARRQPLSAWQSYRHRKWARRHAALEFHGFLNDDVLVRLIEASDAIVIPRLKRQMNTGLLPLAMTFATPVIAPDFGVYTELLGTSENELYTPDDANALAGAIDRMAHKPAEALRTANRELSSQWGWDFVVRRILDQIGGPTAAVHGR